MSQDRKKPLSSDQLSELRARKYLGDNEFAYIAGDLVVAENAISGDKRVIGDNTILVESNKRVLKG